MRALWRNYAVATRPGLTPIGVTAVRVRVARRLGARYATRSVDLRMSVHRVTMKPHHNERDNMPRITPYAREVQARWDAETETTTNESESK